MQLEAEAKRAKQITRGGFVIEMDNAEYDDDDDRPVSPPVSRLPPPILSQRKTMYTPAGVR